MENRAVQALNGAIPKVPDHELYRCIGRGASGQVWLARHTVLGQWRAVKLVGSSDEAARERELRGLHRYEPVSRSHAGLMPVLQVGHTGDGWLFAVLELADNASAPGIAAATTFDHPHIAVPGKLAETNSVGRSLSPRASEAEIQAYRPLTLAESLQQCGRLPVRNAIGLGLQLIDAVSFLHARDLVHRDLKPSNVILLGGCPKLSDPGTVTESTGTRSLVGTPDFTPWTGAGTPSADLYSLGKILYQAASGRAPRDVAELPTRSLDLTEQTQFLELQEVLFRACAENPKERYPTAAAMRRDLERILEGNSLRRERFLRHWTQIGLIGAALALLALAGVGSAWRHEVSRNGTIRFLAEENRRQLVYSYTAHGQREMQNGGLLAAAAWFGEALKSASPGEEELLRYRIETCLQLTPNLIHAGNHQRAISEANFSPDGSTFVTVSEDGTARIWSTASGQEVAPAMEHGQEVSVGQYSADGTRLVTGCVDGSVRIWDPFTGGLVLGPLRSGRETLAASFSPDGRLVVAADRSGEVRVWVVASGELAFPPLFHRPAPRAPDINMEHASFSPNSRWLVTAGSEGEARIWEAATGAQQGPVIHHAEGVRYAVFSPDSRHLATAGTDGIARVWDVETGASMIPPIYQADLYFVAYSPDGTRLLTAGGTSSGIGEARIWNAATGTAVSVPIYHAARVKHAAFSPDGRWVATASQDASVRLLDTTTHESSIVQLPHSQFVWSVAFSPDGRRLLTAGREKTWRLWDLEPRSRAIGEFGPQPGVCPDAELTPGQRLVTARQFPPGVSIRNLANRRSLISIPLEGYPGEPIFSKARTEMLISDKNGNAAVWRIEPPERIRELPPFVSQIARVGYSLSRSRIATIQAVPGAKPAVAWRLWNGETLEPMSELVPVGSPWSQARQVAINGSGTQVAVGVSILDHLERGLLAVYDVQTHQLAWPGIELPGIPDSVEFSPDGILIAASCGTPRIAGQAVRIYIYNAQTGKRAGRPLDHGDGVAAVAFSPDGRLLATGCEDGNLQFWRVPDGQPASLPHNLHNRGIIEIAWSPDGRRLASSHADHTVHIWDPSTGNLLSPPLPHGGDILRIQFSNDGNLLMTRALDGFTRTWNLSAAAGSIPEIRQRIEKASGLRIVAGTAVSAVDDPTTVTKPADRN